MKACSNCGANLPTALDEYGHILYPVCVKCWELNSAEVAGLEHEVKVLRRELNNLNDQLYALEEEISEVENELIGKRGQLAYLYDQRFHITGGGFAQRPYSALNYANKQMTFKELGNE